MKTIYSTEEFLSLVGEIAKAVNQDYYEVRVTRNSKNGYEFQSYIHGYNYNNGNTMEESLAKLKENVFPVPTKNQNIDVEIEPQEVANAEKD